MRGRMEELMGRMEEEEKEKAEARQTALGRQRRDLVRQRQVAA